MLGDEDTACGEVDQPTVGRGQHGVLPGHEVVVASLVWFLDEEWPGEPEPCGIGASPVDVGEEHWDDGGLQVLRVQLRTLCVVCVCECVSVSV